MKVQRSYRIIVENIPAEHREWFNPIADTLNRFMSDIPDALISKLTFGDNFNAQIKELTFTNSAAFFPISFNVTITGKPTAVLKLYVTDISDSPVAITDAVDVVWEFTQNRQVKISNIIGLTADQKYRIILLVF